MQRLAVLLSYIQSDIPMHDYEGILFRLTAPGATGDSGDDKALAVPPPKRAKTRRVLSRLSDRFDRMKRPFS